MQKTHKYLDENGAWVILIGPHQKFGGTYWSSVRGFIDEGEAEMIVNALNQYREGYHPELGGTDNE